ncbi:MAG: FKBP-type peptidyl-prolyl cis-trans isomerase [Bacteroidales bacterium]|nr:FKBP-type peptidyl-prolyl cis-trans isomerase [Bacteroidales bacterium]
MYLNFRTILPFLIGTLFIILIGCNTSQEFIETDTGLKYKFYIENSTNQKVQLYDVVEIYMNYRSKDSVLYSGGSSKIPFQIVPVYPGDLMEGILMMHLNDSATFVLNTRDFFFKMMQYNEIPEHAAKSDLLFFDVKIVSISPETPSIKARRLEHEKRKDTEADRIAQYLKNNNIDIEPTKSGLLIISLIEGTGKLAKKGDDVKVHFSSYFLDGTSYISSYEKNYPVTFTVGEGTVIAGMDEALETMREGDKVKLIVPSSLAYGMVQRDNIKPYTPMIFEIELIEVK